MSKETLERRPNESYTAYYRRSRGEEARKARPGDGHQRIVRAVLAATALMFVVLVWLVVDLGADRDEVLGYLGTSFLFVVGPLLLGLAAGGVWVLLKWLRRRR